MGRRVRGAQVLAAVIAGLLALGWVLTAPRHERASQRVSVPLATVPVSPTTTVATPGRVVPTTVRKAVRVSPWPRRAWVDVPVANVWDHVDSARPLDAAMNGSAPSITTWLAGLDYQSRLGLDDLLATQVLLDDPVVVLDQQGGWMKVRVTHQTGARWRQGIEGWMPAGQIAFSPPARSRATATISANLVVVGHFRLSYGTVLPVLRASGNVLVVAVPGGPVAVPSADLRTRPLAGTGTAVVAETERFLGLPYLWAGTSGYGFDCSGLTFAVYRQFGITLPRDAADQAGAGTPVPRTGLEPGDLVFFAFGGPIDHVGIYAGNGKMIDAPKTGGAVELVNMWGTPLSTHLVSAARYLPR